MLGNFVAKKIYFPARRAARGACALLTTQRATRMFDFDQTKTKMQPQWAKMFLDSQISSKVDVVEIVVNYRFSSAARGACALLTTQLATGILDFDETKTKMQPQGAKIFWYRLSISISQINHQKSTYKYVKTVPFQGLPSHI